MEFCEICQKNLLATIEQDGRIDRVHHFSPKTFFASLQAGCPLCRSLWTRYLVGCTYESSDESKAYYYNHFYRSGDPTPPGRSKSLVEYVGYSLRDFKTFSSFLDRGPLEHEWRYRSFFSNPRARMQIWLHLQTRFLVTRHLAKFLSGKRAEKLATISYYGCKSHDSEVSERRLVELLFLGTHMYLGSLTPIFYPLNVMNVSRTESTEIAQEWTSAALPLCNSWLATCLASHERCSALTAGFALPRRLVEIVAVETSAQFLCRIVHPEAQTHHSYFTLSHCWGRSAHLCLTKANREKLMNSFDSSILPKTFQDALTITWTLGQRYIWIDSLCIVQDDSADWAEQVDTMADIYQNATVNIAAVWGTDGDQGCFSKRDPNLARLTSIYKHQDSGKHWSLWDISAWNDNVADAPLNRRGWVLQERMLAVRQMNFAKDQVFWQCQEMLASEQVASGVPVSIATSSNRNRASTLFTETSIYSNGAVDLRKVWDFIVTEYSQCSLTKTEDRLPALSGVVSRFKARTNDVYLEGMWRNDLRLQLLWKATYEPQSKRQRVHGMPSWSWLSVLGAVIPDHRYVSYATNQYQDIDLLQDIALLDSTTDLTNLGQATSGRISLTGIGTWARWDDAARRDDYVEVVGEPKAKYRVIMDPGQYFCFWSLEMQGKHLISLDRDQITLDLNSTDPFPAEVLIMWLQTTQENLSDSEYGLPTAGLILQQVSSSSSGGPSIFRRIGMVETWTSFIQTELSTALDQSSSLEGSSQDQGLKDPRLLHMIKTVIIE